MDDYYKNIAGEYITAIGTGTGGEPITQDEYDAIMAVIRSRPETDAGFDYMLRTDLTWELAELPPQPDEPEEDETEAKAIGYDIIVGQE